MAPVLCRVLVITYLIIHECPRHHCNRYTSETRPTPHFAASVCSCCYVHVLSAGAYVLLPVTDTREVICGSSAPRPFSTEAQHSLTQISAPPPNNHFFFLVFFAEEVLSLRFGTGWHKTRVHAHLLHMWCIRACVYYMYLKITRPNKESEAYTLFRCLVAAWGKHRIPRAFERGKMSPIGAQIKDFILSALISHTLEINMEKTPCRAFSASQTALGSWLIGISAHLMACTVESIHLRKPYWYSGVVFKDSASLFLEENPRS